MINIVLKAFCGLMKSFYISRYKIKIIIKRTVVYTVDTNNYQVLLFAATT